MTSPVSPAWDRGAGRRHRVALLAVAAAISGVMLTSVAGVGAAAGSRPAGVGKPGPPTFVMALPENGAVKVMWVAPPRGAWSYVAVTNTNAKCFTYSLGTSCTITGLTNGTRYIVRVWANNGPRKIVPSPKIYVTPTAGMIWPF